MAGDTTKNSLSTLLSQFIRLNRNALETFERINEAVTSNKETVDVDLFDDDNNLKRIQVPSFGFLKSEIGRLDNNLLNMSGLSGGSTNIKLADGSFRKVITSKLKSPANTISDVQSPTTFKFKNNWFFEDLLNPLMYINVDVTGQISSDTTRILTKTYILQLDTERKRKFFNDNLKRRSDIDFIEFNNQLISENIEFIPDDDIRDLPPRELIYEGSFDILDISNSESQQLVDGTEVTTRRKTYKLNKLTYTDLTSGFPDTVGLKVGDSLVVNSSVLDTRYKVKEIDSSTNTVVLEKIEGYQGLSIGIDKLKIYKESDTPINIEIPISFDSYKVIFIKSVDPVSNIPSTSWSPGIAFYTNDLVLDSEEEEVVSLDTFYRNEVTDFGLFLLSLAKDGVTPSSLALEPNIPELSADNLKVTQVNNHITDNATLEDVRALSDERNRLSSEIKELDSAISNKKTTIGTKQYNSIIERDKDRSELNSLIEQRSSASKLFSSIVEEISSKVENEDLLNIKPKYRIRGFIPIPAPKVSKFTGPQEIVAIEYEYRYISVTGAGNKVEQFVENTESGQIIGAQSNWIKGELITRKKVEDPLTGNLIWENQSIEDPEQININQVDIPIQKGESVEIRARALSEAGYPANPASSIFSEIIRINFPDDIIESSSISEIVSENEKEAQRVKLEEDLKEKGVITHIDDQFIANEKTFKHDALNIFSGELTAEQTPISLFEKLQDLTTRLRRVEEIISRVKGELKVKILDDNGNETIVEKDNLVKLFAGYYSEQVKDLDIKKGAIISRTYFISLENISATTLELISRLPGNRELVAFESGNKFGSTTTAPEIQNDNYYVNRGKYDYVPVLYTNPDNIIEDFINNSPFQSSQLRGQFIYARYKDVAGTEDFYIDFDIDTSNVINLVDDAEYFYNGITYGNLGNPLNDFVWAGTYTGSDPDVTSIVNTVTEYDSNNIILLHKEHPLVKDINKPAVDIFNDKDIRIAKTATLTSDNVNGKKQTGYYFDNINQRTIKCAFDPEDQFTLGRASVGSYMFIASSDERTLTVNGNDSLSIKEIEFGPNNTLRIPVVFQYRMTDFAGVGVTTGTGFIGGDRTLATRDITYAKRMGFDIITYDGTNETRFSFDLEIFAKYKSNKLNLEKLPVRNIGLAIGDLSNIGNNTRGGAITPNIGIIR
jgi:hypothetical protein